MRICSFAIVAACALLLPSAFAADNMGAFSIAPATGAVTLTERWAITTPNLAGFHFMAQDLGLVAPANSFYSLKAATIPSGGDVAGFSYYIASSGSATAHVDIGSKLKADSYSGLTSADPDLGFGAVQFYMIHHKGTTDYLTHIVPGTSTASAVTDLKPMSAAGGPATVTGVSGYFGLAFSATDLGYGANLFFYLRKVGSNTKFGVMGPGLADTSADLFDLGTAEFSALYFIAADLGYGVNKMYYLRIDSVTGFSIFGTVNPVSGAMSDIANLGSVFKTLTFAPADLGFGLTNFYSAGTFSAGWQVISFAKIAPKAISSGAFSVTPYASSGLALTLTVVGGSTGAATISGPIAGVFTVTPTSAGVITLQASQAGASSPIAYEANSMRQTFTIGSSAIAATPEPTATPVPNLRYVATTPTTESPATTTPSSATTTTAAASATTTVAATSQVTKASSSASSISIAAVLVMSMLLLA